MKTYMTIEEIIKEAEKNGVDFGSGDPYNRLRYYNKMGWIPHMIRKKTDKGTTEGHYHRSIVDRLLVIQELKDTDKTNEEITQRLSNTDKAKDLYSYLKTDQFRNKLIAYGSFMMLLFILLTEFGILQVGQSKNAQDILQTSTTLRSTENVRIVKSGSSTISSNESSTVVQANSIKESSKVYVTFIDNYSPASRFWVAEKVEGEGFRVDLDEPSAQNARFEWWISE